MKIKKSKLKTIIVEEIQNVLLNEDWKETLSSIGGALKTGMMSGAKSKIKSFGTLGAKENNWFTRGAYKAYGQTRVSRIDEIFEDLLEELKEFGNHPEADRLSGPPEGSMAGPEPSPGTLGEGRRAVRALIKKLQKEIIYPWVYITTPHRGEEPDEAEEEEEETLDVDWGPEEEKEELEVDWGPEGPPEEEGSGIAEVIRRQVRRELKRRSTF